MSCLQNAQELYSLIGQGKIMDGFEKFYAENCVIVEPNGDTRNGKAAQREAIGQWNQMVTEFHGGGVGSITSNEEAGVAMIETWTDVTMNGNRVKMEEVAVQKWENGQIVHERFYYNMPPMPGIEG